MREPVLTQTRELIAQYGQKIIQETISNEELLMLLDATEGIFKQSIGYVNPNTPVMDKNFSVADGIIDVVLTLAPELSEEQLHVFNERLINLFFSSYDQHEFLRKSTLDKYFLCYEMVHFPQNANRHFESEGIVTKKISEQATKRSHTFLNQCVILFNMPDQQSRFEPAKNTNNVVSVFNPMTMYYAEPHHKIDASLLEKYRDSLNRFIRHYNFLAELDEKRSGKNVMGSGRQRVAVKRVIAEALLSYIENMNDASNSYGIYREFERLLNANDLSRNDFFDGKTNEFIIEELRNVLRERESCTIEI